MNKEKHKNSVTLEGPVCSCSIVHDTPDAVLARMEIVTAAKVREQGKTRLTNAVIHRVLATVSGEDAKRLRNIAAKPIDLTGDISKGDYVHLEGSITAANGHPFVAVPQEGFRFLERMAFRNKIELEGRIVEVSYNSAYAGAVLACSGHDGNTVLITVNIYSKDNPRRYSDLASNKVKKDDVISVKGPLVGGYYSNGEKQVYRCTVNVSTYDLQSKKKQQKTTPLGV